MLKQLRDRFSVIGRLQSFANLFSSNRNRGQSRRRSLARFEQLERRELLAGDLAACVAESAPAEEMRIGTNLEAVYDWSPAWLFTDIFKHSRDWIAHEQNTETFEFVWEGTSAVHTDERGWPTQLEQWTNADGQLIVQSLGTLMFREINGNYPGGLYRAEWDGAGSIASGSVAFDWDATVIAHGQTPAGRNFADLQVTPSNEGIYLGINQIADPNHPIENINVWMPDYQGQSFVGQRDWVPGASFSPFHPLFVERLSSLDTLRFMQISGTLDTDAVAWSQRRELSDARQVVTDRVADGVAPEYMTELANQVGSHAWLNMPHAANDDYVRNLATMVRDTLDPALTIYVEWSNEAWNPDYDVYHWVTEQIDPSTGLDRWDIMAGEIRRDFDIWRDVFAGQEERLVRVVGTFNHTPQVATELLARMNGEFDALASSAYVAPDFEERATFVPGITTPEDVLQHTLDSTATTLGFLNEHKTLLEDYEQSLGRDLGFILYEGGLHLDVDDTPVPEVFAQAFASEQIYGIEELVLNGTHDLGVELFVDFQYTERLNDGVGFNATLGGNFGSLRYQDQPIEEAHKFRALLDAIDGDLIDVNNQRPSVTEINNYVIEEGETLQISFAISDAETPADSLVLITDSSESDLLPNTAITILGSGTNRTLVITPQPSSITQALVTVLVVDGDGGTSLESFQLEVIPVQLPGPNTPPTAVNASLVTAEDAPLWIDLAALADDAETPFQQLAFAFSNVMSGTVTRFDTWSAIFTPDSDFNGQASFSYSVTDDGTPPLSAAGTVDISVTPVNDAPVAGHVTLTTNEDTPIEFSLLGVIGDVETPDAQLSVTFPSVWGGTLASNGQVHGYRFVPAAEESGTVQLWFQVVDPEGLQAWGSVTINILSVNDPPTADDASFTTPEDSPVWIPLWQIAGDAETAFEQLDFTFTNAVGGSAIQFDAWSAVFTPDADFNGTASFNYTVADDGNPPLSSTAAITINVTPVNDYPTAGRLTLVTNQDTPVEFSLTGVIGDVETPVEQLQVVFPQIWGGTLVSTGSTHGYRFTPEANEFGTVELWFQVFDANGLDEWGSVRIDVLPVNDAAV